MKKLFFASLVSGLSLLSIESNAAWNYCFGSNQTSTDSWNTYINKTWSGGSNALMVQTQYRYTAYNALTGVYTITAWQDLPASGIIGSSGMGGGMSNVEIREINFWVEGGGPNIGRQFFIFPC